MGSLVLKALQLQFVIAVSTSPWNVWVWSFLVKRQSGVWALSSTHRKKRSSAWWEPLPFSSTPSKETPQPSVMSEFKVILSFLLLVAPLPHPSPYKNIAFCKTSQSALPVARWDAAELTNGLIKPIRSSTLLGWILVFNKRIKKIKYVNLFRTELCP